MPLPSIPLLTLPISLDSPPIPATYNLFHSPFIVYSHRWTPSHELPSIPFQKVRHLETYDQDYSNIIDDLPIVLRKGKKWCTMHLIFYVVTTDYVSVSVI